MAYNLFEDLVNILRDRDVPYDRDALKSACKDLESQTAIREWMEEYLTPETLLTKDEVAVYVSFYLRKWLALIYYRYANLTKTGEFERLAAQDLSAVHGQNDSEIRDAIEELKRSTAAIEKQSEALKLQQNAMGTLVKNNQRNSQARSLSSDTQVKKWNVERDRVSRAVSVLSASLLWVGAKRIKFRLKICRKVSNTKFWIWNNKTKSPRQRSSRQWIAY